MRRMADKDTVPIRRRRIRFILKRSLLVAPLALCAWFGFGLSEGDYASLRTFTESVERWQTNPEFRSIAYDYSIRGSAAMRTRPLLIPAQRGIIAVRSVPGLPPEYAMSSTSRAHYENFSSGPLGAYLFLSDEQNVSGVAGLFEELGKKPSPTAADYRALLDGIHMDFPVVKDAGAVKSVEALAADVGPASFSIKTPIGPLLRRHIAAIATELGFPTDPMQMAPDQQRAVLERLDGHVRRHDPELWRTKQVSDFCGGFWAQLYGPPYNGLLVPFLKVHRVCQWVLIIALLALLFRRLRLRERTDPARDPDPSRADPDSGQRDDAVPSATPFPSGT